MFGVLNYKYILYINVNFFIVNPVQTLWLPIHVYKKEYRLTSRVRVPSLLEYSRYEFAQ